MAQDISSGVDAEVFSYQLEMIVAMIDLYAEAAFQLFDVVVKRAAQTKQAFIIRRFEGNFFLSLRSNYSSWV
ncbi:hypothetical protein DZS_25780 [Dickeya ananatis]